MADEHTALPIRVPSLVHLTDQELSDLRSKLTYQSREARRRATQAIGKSSSLQKLFNKTLNLTKDTKIEERENVMAMFEKELLRVPDAFIAHAYANSLILLDVACRDELLRRKGPAPKKKKATDTTPPAKTEGSSDIMSIVDALSED